MLSHQDAKPERRRSGSVPFHPSRSPSPSSARARSLAKANTGSRRKDASVSKLIASGLPSFLRLGFGDLLVLGTCALEIGPSSWPEVLGALPRGRSARTG